MGSVKGEEQAGGLAEVSPILVSGWVNGWILEVLQHGSLWIADRLGVLGIVQQLC